MKCAVIFPSGTPDSQSLRLRFHSSTEPIVCSIIEAELGFFSSQTSQHYTLRKLVKEIKTPGLEPTRRDEILDIILANIG